MRVEHPDIRQSRAPSDIFAFLFEQCFAVYAHIHFDLVCHPLPCAVSRRDIERAVPRGATAVARAARQENGGEAGS